MKKYNIRTYGCQMNELDSDRIGFILSNLGYEKTEELEEADMVIYNTCAIRENAELKVYGHLGALKTLKEENPDLIIALCGCMMEIEETRKEIKDKYRHVDLVFGTKNIDQLPELMEKEGLTEKIILETDPYDDIHSFQYASRESPVSAFVSIIYGCDNFCTYCIVPYVRGREASRDKDTIIKEIRDLADKGYKEITLLGQNVNSYGRSLYKDYRFPQLLEDVAKVDGIERIRFMSSHPKDLSDELIEVMARTDKIAKNFHLPLQSGSNNVLKAMNRKYSIEEYLNRVDKLRAAIPEIGLTTDIIVGFPGESDEDFLKTMEIIDKVKYDQVFLFKYSSRMGTAASKMQGHLDDNIISERFQRTLEAINDICYEKNSVYLDKTVDVLVEGRSKNKDNILTGRTTSNKIVNFPGDIELIGKLIPVFISNYNSFSLEGQCKR